VYQPAIVRACTVLYRAFDAFHAAIADTPNRQGFPVLWISGLIFLSVHRPSLWLLFSCFSGYPINAFCSIGLSVFHNYG